MNILEKLVEKVIDGLENGTIPWRKTWKGIYPMNAFNKHEYQGFNVLYLSCFGSQYSFPLFGTFKQISEAGGRVKKGESAFPVVYWKITEKEQENAETGEDETIQRFTPFYNNVFNLEQAEGLDIDKYVSDITPTSKNNTLEVCETVIKNMPNPPSFEHGDPRAFYRPSTDMVNVPEIRLFDNSEAYYATMFHELAHATGHPSRLKRFESNKTEFGKNSYDYEELVAEMAATFLCSYCSIEQTLIENSVAYLTSWASFLKKERKTTLFGAATKAQAAVNYILGKQPETETQE